MLCNAYTQIKITKQKHSKLDIIKFALSLTQFNFNPFQFAGSPPMPYTIHTGNETVPKAFMFHTHLTPMYITQHRTVLPSPQISFKDNSYNLIGLIGMPN